MKKLICIIFISIFVISISIIPSRQIYIKADESYQWVPINNGLYGGGIESLAIDPKNSSIIYAGTRRDGIYKSMDGGENWSETCHGLTSTWFNSVAIDPNNTQIIYAGGSFLFKSTDGGTNWMQLSANSTSSIAIDPNNTEIIYAGGWGGLFKSTNGGGSWKTINTGLTNTKINSLVIDPSNTMIIYAGTRDGLFKSTNGGLSWSSINTGLTKTYINSLAIDPSNPSTIYAGTWNGGVFKSSNSGLSWIQVNKGLTKTNLCVEFLAIDSKNTQTIYIAINSYGAFKSTDGGSSWSAINSGLTNTDVSSLAIDPTNTQVIYAGTNGGVFKSTDGGDLWSKMSNGIASSIESFAIDHLNSQVIYAGVETDGIYKSLDGGKSWNKIWLVSLSAVSLAIDPQNTEVIYAGSNGMGVFKATDGGITWIQTKLSSGYIFSLTIDPTNTQTIYAGTWDDGIFKSTNGGASWTPINSGLTNTDVYSLAIDPTNTQTIYAGTWNGGVFKSTNGGSTWSKMNSGLTNTNVPSLAINPTNTQTIYAGTWGGGVFKSTNGGTDWTQMNSGLTNTDVKTISIDPINTQVIYIGAKGGDIFKSTNGGSSWTRLNTGIKVSDFTCLDINPGNTQIIYAGSSDAGMFKYGIIDNNPPTLEIVSPESKTLSMNENRISVKGKAVDSETNIANLIFSNTCPLLNGVRTIYTSGSPGLVTGLSSDISYLVTGDKGSKPFPYAPVVVASFSGYGRVIAFGHDGFFSNTDFSSFDNEQFALNVVKWLDKDSKKIIYLTTCHGEYGMPSSFSSFTTELVNKGYKVNTISQNISDSYLPENGVLIIGCAWKDFQNAELDTIKNFVDKGGGLLMWGLGWSFVQYNQPKTIEDFPMNKIGQIFRIKWQTDIITDPTSNLNGHPLFSTFNDIAQSVSIEADGSFEINAELTEGENCLKLVAFDEGGNKTECIINVTCKKILTFIINSSSGFGGSIAPSGTVMVNEGNSKSFTISPNSGYRISNVQVDGVSKGPIPTYTFANVTSNHIISATFEKEVTETVIILQIGNTTFTINGQSRTLDSPPVIKNNRTLLPIRAVVEALGGTVGWDETERKVTVILGSKTIELWIGKSIAKVNGIDTPIDAANSKVVPEIINSRTMLPLRFVAENLGCTVEWDGTTKTITITYQP